MKKKSLDWLLILHSVIILWAALFFSGIFIFENGKFASVLAFGNIAGLFICIPFQKRRLTAAKIRDNRE